MSEDSAAIKSSQALARTALEGAIKYDDLASKYADAIMAKSEMAADLATLRAASRELVEALKTIASWGTDGEVQDFARAAIAKATT